MNKLERQGEPSNAGELKFPSLALHDLAFGENPFYQLNSQQFEYSFIGQSSQKFVYYTMSVYQHNWGLTAYQKSEYQIRITADITARPVVESTRSSSHSAESARAPSAFTPAQSTRDWLKAPTTMLNNALHQVNNVNVGLAGLVSQMSG